MWVVIRYRILALFKSLSLHPETPAVVSPSGYALSYSFHTMHSEMLILSVVLLCVGAVCTPVKQDPFQRTLGVLCLVGGLSLALYLLVSR